MHQDIAFRTAYLLTGSAADAEDAAQAGFVKAWTALPRFRRGAPFRPWLLRIVANEAHNRRSAGRQEALRLRSRAALPPDDAAPSPERAALGHEQREELLAAFPGSTIVTATRSRVATSWSSRRTRRPRPSTYVGARSSRGRRVRSSA